MFDREHDLFWARRRKSLWREKIYNDPQLLALFPRLSDSDLRNLTGGKYSVKKCQGYLSMQLDYFKIRHTQLENTSQSSNVSETTYNTAILNKSFSFKVEVLCEESLQRHFPQFDAIVRSDCSSYYSKWKRFKTIVGIKRGVPNRFTFGCTCSTGNRTTPCVHNIIFLRLFGQVIPMLPETLNT